MFFPKPYCLLGYFARHFRGGESFAKIFTVDWVIFCKSYENCGILSRFDWPGLTWPDLSISNNFQTELFCQINIHDYQTIIALVVIISVVPQNVLFIEKKYEDDFEKNQNASILYDEIFVLNFSILNHSREIHSLNTLASNQRNVTCHAHKCVR